MLDLRQKRLRLLKRWCATGQVSPRDTSRCWQPRHGRDRCLVHACVAATCLRVTAETTSSSARKAATTIADRLPHLRPTASGLAGVRNSARSLPWPHRLHLRPGKITTTSRSRSTRSRVASRPYRASIAAQCGCLNRRAVDNCRTRSLAS